MPLPLVSVIVPTYNRADCVGRAIDSALAQTHSNVEVIVVDDGSSDNTAELLRSRYANEPRVRCIQQANQGVCGARNRGLREAKGEFIALLDSDDTWVPWKLEAQLACLAALPEAGMIWTDMDAVDPNGTLIAPRYLTKMYSAYAWWEPREKLFSRSRRFGDIAPQLASRLGLESTTVSSGDIFSQMVMGNLVHTSTVLLRRERLAKVKEFDMALTPSGEDYDFHLRTCREGDVAYLDAVTIHYQVGRDDALTFKPKYAIHLARNFLGTVTRALERDRDRIHLPKEMIDAVLAEAHGWVGDVHMARGEHREARAHLFQSLRRHPMQPRLAMNLALSLFPREVTDKARAVYRKARGRNVAS